MITHILITASLQVYIATISYFYLEEIGKLFSLWKIRIFLVRIYVSKQRFV